MRVRATFTRLIRGTRVTSTAGVPVSRVRATFIRLTRGTRVTCTAGVPVSRVRGRFGRRPAVVRF
jgi:hypothetical protein